MSSEFINEYILEIVGGIVFLGIWFANTIDAYATGITVVSTVTDEGDIEESTKKSITVAHAFALGFARVFSKQTAMFLFNVITVITIVVKALWTVIT